MKARSAPHQNGSHDQNPNFEQGSCDQNREGAVPLPGKSRDEAMKAQLEEKRLRKRTNTILDFGEGKKTFPIEM
jgi:hypothetical protein